MREKKVKIKYFFYLVGGKHSTTSKHQAQHQKISFFHYLLKQLLIYDIAL